MTNIISGATVTRDTQKTDTLYVNPDHTVWFTPDGVGRILLFSDPDTQEIPMTLDEARDEIYYDTIVYLDENPDD